MNKRRITKHILEMFLFDVKKEQVIYAYLCKKRLNRKQKRLLQDEIRFKSYQAWETYIIAKYEELSKENLIEFSKVLNMLLRESRKFDEYSRNMWIAYISASFSALITAYLSEVVIKIALIFTIIFLPFILSFLIIYVYKYFGTEEVYFIEDVKNIIDKMVENKC